MFFFHLDRFASARVTARARIPLLDRKRPKTAQFNTVSTGHRIGDFTKDRVHDPLYIALKKVWIFVSDFLNQFRPDHRQCPLVIIFGTLCAFGPTINRNAENENTKRADQGLFAPKMAAIRTFGFKNANQPAPHPTLLGNVLPQTRG